MLTVPSLTTGEQKELFDPRAVASYRMVEPIWTVLAYALFVRIELVTIAFVLILSTLSFVYCPVASLKNVLYTKEDTSKELLSIVVRVL